MSGTGSQRAGAAVSATLAAVALLSCGSSSDAGTEQFRGQTKSPVLDFGKEGTEPELARAVAAVNGFLADRAREDWAAVCRQLAEATVRKLEHLAASSTELDEASCEGLLGAFTRLSPQERREDSTGSAGLRVEAKRGYLVYASAGDHVYAMPLVREGGGWKVTAITARELG